MNNEETRLINDEPARKEQTKAGEQPKKSGKVHPAAAAAGGFVAGAAVGVGATAFANAPAEEVPEVELETPEPEDVLLANDEGIRYAHVEADNFSDAFAQARAQVGPGGVFEYEGRMYSTYTAEEWNDMSADERADFQGRVDEVAPAYHVAETHHIEAVAEESVAPDAEMISVEPVDNEIHVLGAESVETPDGVINAVYVESDGVQGVMLDVNDDGRLDVIAIDANGNGELDAADIVEEIPDGVDITLSDMEQMYYAQNDDPLYAANDGLEDYINDADSILDA